jgi:hypothetical protein
VRCGPASAPVWCRRGARGRRRRVAGPTLVEHLLDELGMLLRRSGSSSSIDKSSEAGTNSVSVRSVVRDSGRRVGQADPLDLTRLDEPGGAQRAEVLPDRAGEISRVAARSSAVASPRRLSAVSTRRWVGDGVISTMAMSRSYTFSTVSQGRTCEIAGRAGSKEGAMVIRTGTRAGRHVSMTVPPTSVASVAQGRHDPRSQQHRSQRGSAMSETVASARRDAANETGAEREPAPDRGAGRARLPVRLAAPTSTPTSPLRVSTRDVVRFISAKKNEPEWLLEWRLSAYEAGPRWTSPTGPS